jgi:uncharacterized protein (TIGR00251 family)
MTDVALHITAFGSASRFEVHAKPKAKKSAIVSVVEGRLEVAIAAQPNDGAANDELVRFLAKTLGLKQRDVNIVRGQSARIKLIELRTLSADEARARLEVEMVSLPS